MTFDIDTRRPYMTLFAIQKYLHVLLTYLLDYITQGPGSFLITVFFSVMLARVVSLVKNQHATPIWPDDLSYT